MTLPKPVWTDHDVTVAWEVDSKPSSLSWNTWNDDPTKMAVLRAIVSCRVRLRHEAGFDWNMIWALTQKRVCSFRSYSLEVEEVHY